MNATLLSSTFQELPKVLFSWFDYTLFAGMLGISVLIGIYFGFCGNKQNTKEEYLLGGKTMKAFPIAISLVASHTSGITLLAVPADIYKFGSGFWWFCLTIPLVCLITCYVYLPVFFQLEITSMYEYLNLRFDRKIRSLASFLFIVSVFFYLPIVVYIPALAFSQVTGIYIHYVTPVVCIICVFYTTIGGLKAVVWTDTLQFGGIVGSVAAVFFLGASAAGGFDVVWKKAVEGDRLDVFNFSFDPTLRDSFWIFVFGTTAHWICNICLNQGSIQKFISVPSLQQAKKSAFYYCIGMVIIQSLSIFTGSIMYAKYADCDLLSTKQVTRLDQLLPYFVMDVSGKIPGLPGIFIAGVFSAGLSTLSASLNTVAGTIYEDFVLPFLPVKVAEQKASNILKLIVAIAGTLCTLLVLVVEKMGGLFPLNTALQGICGGPLVGLFTLGMLFPMANAKGALYGGLSSLIFISFVAFGNQYYQSQGMLKDFSKPMSVDGCDFFVNVTLKNNTLMKPEPFVLYRISFWYNSLMATIVAISVGLVVSWITKEKDHKVDRKLISPVAQFLLGKEDEKAKALNADYYALHKALEMVAFDSEQSKN